MAAELVHRYRLSPPVDVWSLAERFAEVEETPIPGGCDGLVVGLHAVAQPRIVVSADQPAVRQRFTLGHELGHVVLGWHLGGGFLCDTDVAFPDFETHQARLAEREANRFAAELLVPSAWLEDQIHRRSDESVAPLMHSLREAHVSSYVACFRLLDMLPRGHAFTVTALGGQVLATGQTPGTGVALPRRGETLDRERLDRFAETTEDVRFGPTRVVWWTFRGAAALDEVAADTRSSRELLRELLNRHAADQVEGERIHRSLAGIIGVANGEARKEGVRRAEALHVRFRSRFAQERELPAAMLEDQDFDSWLGKRALELGDAF